MSKEVAIQENQVNVMKAADALVLFAALLGSVCGYRSYVPYRIVVGSQRRAQPTYDGFESDPVLIDRLRIESERLRSLPTRAIKDEMEKMKLRTSHIFDRDELIRKLAIARIKAEMSIAYSYAKREADAGMLLDEIDKVSALTDEEVIQRLQKQRVDISNVFDRNELNRKLAMMNVGLGPPQLTSAAPAAEAAVAGDGMALPTEDEGLGIVDGLMVATKRLRESLEEPVTMATKGVGWAFSETTSRMAKIVSKDIAYTRAEMKAMGVIEGKPVDASIPSSESDSVSEMQVLEQLLAEARQFATFDDVHDWALTKTRPVLAKMLRYLRVGIPKYAPQSTLASFLADSIMLERDVPLAPASDTETMEVDVLQRISSGGGGGANIPYARKPRPRTSRKAANSFTAYAPERELLDAFVSKTSRMLTVTFPQIWRQVVNIENADELLRSSLRLVFKSPLAAVFVSFIRLASAVGNDLVQRLAEWAGGKTLAPSQSLFLASLYCILLRRGLVSFLGVLAAIRLGRILFRENYDDDAPRKTDSLSSN